MPWALTPPRPQVTQLFVDNKIRFVWSTDVHIDSVGGARYANLVASLTDCAERRPAAYIFSGDLTPYGEKALLEGAFYKLRDAQAKLIVIPGNHDEEENTFGLGNPNSALLAASNVFNDQHPFYYSTTIKSGDNSLQALVLCLDNNFYNGFSAPSPYHTEHQRTGIHTTNAAGGYSRELGPTQLAWIENTLASDHESNMIIVVTHYNGAMYDYDQLANKLQADGRPAFGLCGHHHPSTAVVTITSTNGLNSYSIYKAPAMQESGCWIYGAVGLSSGAIQIAELTVKNFTNPGGWSISSPFTQG